MGVVLSLGVLAVNAAVSGDSPDGPGARLEQLAYVDRARPAIERSTALGAEIVQLRADPVVLGRNGIGRRMDRATTEARAVLTEARAVEPPEPLAVQHSLLLSTLALRAHAVTAIEGALTAVLADGPVEGAIEALAQSGEDMLAADRTYLVYAESVPREEGSPVLPESRWVGDPPLWSRPELAAFVQTLRSAASPTPVHDVGVLALTTNPAAVATEGTAAVLPLVSSLRLEVVVGNTGNAAVAGVPVIATLQGPGGELDTARDFVDLAPGQRLAVPLAGLRPVPGGPSNLTVIIGPLEGEGAIVDNQRSLTLVMRG